MGIEPTALAWEARVLPLYDARDSAGSGEQDCHSNGADRAAQRWARRGGSSGGERRRARGKILSPCFTPVPA